MKKIILTSLLALLFSFTIFGENPFEGWQETQTEHFTFIYEDRDREFVERLLGFCDEVYNTVTTFLDTDLIHTRVILFGREDMANGYFDPTNNTIALYTAPPIYLHLGQNMENWLKLLFIHEFTHFAHMYYNSGNFINIFGNSGLMVSAAMRAGWTVEGITTNTETLFTQSGRGRNPFFEMYHKAGIIEGNLYSLEQASYKSTGALGGHRLYNGGYILVNHLLTTYGEDIFAKIMKEHLKPHWFGIYDIIKVVTGKELHEIYDEMVETLGKKYEKYKDIPGGELVSPHIVGNYNSPQACDKGILVYRKTHNNEGALVFLDDGGNEKPVVSLSLPDKESFTVTKDGDTIYYTPIGQDSIPGYGSYTLLDLYSYSGKTGDVRRITKNKHLWHPAVSADGSKVIAIQRNGLYSRLVEVDIQTGDVYQLVSLPESTIFNPHISPDGSKITFAVNQRGFQDIYVTDYPLSKQLVDGSNRHDDYNTAGLKAIIGNDKSGEYLPRFADDDTIIFASDRSGALELYSYDLKNEIFTTLFQDPVGAYYGTVYDDRLIYNSYKTSGYCIKQIPLADLPKSAVLKPVDTTPPPITNRKKEVPESRTFIDYPHLNAWFPFPLDITNDADGSIGLGVGTSVFMGYTTSPTKSLMASLAYNFDSAQIFGSFTGPLFDIGPFQTRYTLSQQYSKEIVGIREFYMQQLNHAFYIDLPLFDTAEYGTSRHVVMTLGANHLYSIMGISPFNFVEAFQNTALTHQHGITGFAALVTRISQTSKALSEFYSPGLLFSKNSLSAIISDVRTPENPALRFESISYLQKRTFFDNQYIRFGTKYRYTTATSSSYARRSAYNTNLRETNHNAQIAVDYLFTLGHPDMPLLFDTHLASMGFGLNAETVMNWNDTAFYWAEKVYIGAELSLALGYSRITFPPLTLGIQNEIDLNNPDNFSVNNTKVYFVMSNNSFSSQ